MCSASVPAALKVHGPELICSQENVEPTPAARPNGSGDDEGLGEKRNTRFNRRLDLRVLPLCCWLYLLNFLDRGNIGNARILNKETGDDLMTQTGMSSHGYAITLTLFSVAYAVFEVPSNWVMKHHVRPSVWLAVLLYVVSRASGASVLGYAILS